MRAAAAAAILAAGAALAGCGADKDEYEARVTAQLADNGARYRSVQRHVRTRADGSPQRSARVFAAYAETVLADHRALDGVPAPGDIELEHSRYVSLLGHFGRELRKLAHSLEDTTDPHVAERDILATFRDLAADPWTESIMDEYEEALEDGGYELRLTRPDDLLPLPRP
jgi:hypothetical protein